MKTAISIPDDIFADADRLAQRLGHSRSELYSRAVREYVAKHSPDEITESLDLLLDDVDADSGFATTAGRRALGRSEW